MLQTLTKLLGEQVALRAVVRRVSPSAVWVETGEHDLELPLPGVSLVAGQVVELTRQDDQTIALRVVADPATNVPEGVVPVRTPAELSQVLLEMNVPPTEEALLVAEGLLARGFPLQESLLWSLLPWAERGQLTEAFLALQAKFPLKPEVLALAKQLQNQDLDKPILTRARDGLPPELENFLTKPSLENRARWSSRLGEGKLFKALARLLVEERFRESLLNDQTNHLFALPFLRGEDLYAAWLRITRDQRDETEKDEDSGVQSFQIELEIPTETFGLVRAELSIRGKEVSIIFSSEEGLHSGEASLQELALELQEAGWSVKTLQVRG